MDTAGDAFVITTFIAVVVAKAIERLRVRFPSIDGDIVTLVAVIFGTAVAWAYGLEVASDFGLDGLVAPFSYLMTGLVIAGEAGVIADLTNRSDPGGGHRVEPRETAARP